LSIFKKRHHHDWKVIDKTITTKDFIATRLFGKPYTFSVDCIAVLRRCSECGSEEAFIHNAEGKKYFDIRDIPPGTEGYLDPDYYRAKFMAAPTKEQ